VFLVHIGNEAFFLSPKTTQLGTITRFSTSIQHPESRIPLKHCIFCGFFADRTIGGQESCCRLRPGKKMFDPEYQDMDCPKCLRRKLYADREIGLYCMSCGHVLAADEAMVLLSRTASPFDAMPEPDISRGQSAIKIREISVSRRTATQNDEARTSK
jgi:hypothetical protein